MDDQKEMSDVGVSEIDADAPIQTNDSPEEVAPTNAEEACIEVEPVGYAVSAVQEEMEPQGDSVINSVKPDDSWVASELQFGTKKKSKRVSATTGWT